MATNIVKQITDKEKLSSGAEVTAEQLDRLSKNMFMRIQILENAQFRNIDCSDRTNSVKNDTKTAFFTKDAIDGLFKANPGSDGLLICFGVHNSDIYPLGQPSYQNKMMVVLVTATNQVPNLKVNDKVEIAGAPRSAAEGIDNGKLCPPNTTCG